MLIAAVIMTAGGASPFAAGAFGAAGAYGGLAGNILLGGFAMALGGVSMMLAPTPKADDNADKGSFLFNGATNVSAQGGPVPLVYGDVLTGSVVGSLSITDEQVTISAVASGPYEGFGGNSFGGFGDLFGGTLTTGTFTGMPGGVGGTWDIETDDNTLAAATRLSLVD